MPKVSIALATYNGARFVLEQLESYSNQTRLPDELIVSDDGSTDGTLAIVAKFAEKAPFPVKILPTGPRLGFSDNFIRAASSCRGDLIMFSDQDDVWMPNKIERQLQAMSPEVLLSLHGLVLVDENLKQIGSIKQGIKQTRIVPPLEIDPYTGVGGMGLTLMFRREVLTMVAPAARPGHPERMNDPLDHDTWIYTLAASMGQVAHIDEPLILYRQHSKNVFGVKAARLRDRIPRAITVPISRYRARAEFYESIVGIFGEIEESDQYRLHAPARMARERYQHRLASLRSRLDMYNSARLSDRCRHFRQMCALKVTYKLTDNGSHSELLLSLVKDLMLGIALRSSVNMK